MQRYSREIIFGNRKKLLSIDFGFSREIIIKNGKKTYRYLIVNLRENYESGWNLFNAGKNSGGTRETRFLSAG